MDSGSDEADANLAEVDVANLEAEAATLDTDRLAEVDLDDQTPAMGDWSTPTSSPSGVPAC